MQKLTTHEKVEAARSSLICLATVVDNSILQEVCFQVVTEPNFQRQVGSCDHHHTYRGGLMVHTYEVVTYALEMAKAFGEAVNRDVLLTAAIWHDYMKIREYEVTDTVTWGSDKTHPTLAIRTEGLEIRKTPYRKLVRHVAGSHAEFLLAVAGKGLDPDIQMRIEHALLAHHGRQEWGSPVEPQTLESHLLHSADMISVRFGKDLW